MLNSLKYLLLTDYFLLNGKIGLLKKEILVMYSVISLHPRKILIVAAEPNKCDVHQLKDIVCFSIWTRNVYSANVRNVILLPYIG
jgi:hypothetical protein